MSFFPKQPLIVGVEITPHSFKLAFLKKRGKSFDVIRTEEVESLDSIPSNAVIVSGLSESSVLVRPLEIPLKKEKDINSAFEFQAEPLLPYPLERAVLQKMVASKGEDGTLLTILSVKKDHLKDHLQKLLDKNTTSEIVTSPSAALAALSELIEEKNEPCLLMHLGEKEGVVALVEEGKLLASRAFENDKYEMQKSVIALLNANRPKKIDTIYLFAAEEVSAMVVKEATGKKVVIPEIAKTYPGFSLAIGIALSGTKTKALNFRQKEFVYPHKWKKLRKPLLTYFAASTLFLISLYVLEKTALKRAEEQLLQKSTPALGIVQSKEEVLEKLQKLSKEIEKKPDTFALQPLLPTVSDLLASFGKETQFTTSEEEKYISIDTFNYTLVKRPTFEAKSERYLVQVELEITASNPKIANAFYEYLKNTHPFVDSEKEITWGVENGKYRTTFYLKDKTRYNT